MIPVIGLIFHYTLTKTDETLINVRRKLAHNNFKLEELSGVVMHVGADVSEGETYPIIITNVYTYKGGLIVNGQVMLDGHDTLWVQGIRQGTGPGEFKEILQV